MNLRRFVLRQGNAKSMYFTLRGQDRAPQSLPPGSVVTFTMWREPDLPVKAIDAAPCVVLDDGTAANLGRGRYDFPSLLSASLVPGVYEGRLDVLVGGVVPLTFPDDDGQLDASRKLLILVTAQA